MIEASETHSVEFLEEVRLYFAKTPSITSLEPQTASPRNNPSPRITRVTRSGATELSQQTERVHCEDREVQATLHFDRDELGSFAAAVRA